MSDECPCGLEGVDCLTPVSPLIDVSQALERACSIDGSDEGCVVDDEGASCDCLCGFRGDFCEISQSATALNVFIGVFLAVNIIFLGIFFLIRGERKRKDKINKLKLQYTTSSFEPVPPVILLVVRVLGLISYLAVIPEYILNDPDDFLTFSLWSFVLYGITFFLGTIISIKGLCNRPTVNDKVSVLETVYAVLLENVLPSTLLLTIVYWAVLVPGADEEDLPLFFAYNAIVVHGVNLFFLLLEASLNNLFVIRFHFWYTLIYGSSYVFFHQALVIYYQATNQPPCPQYFFLDYSLDLFLVFLLGLLLATTLFYFIIYFLSQLKKKNSTYIINKE